MKTKTYFVIRLVDGVLELKSLVWTNFGGFAENFVKSSPFADELRRFALGQGWEELTQDTLKVFGGNFVKCTCVTKTPDVSYHKRNCKYRKFIEETL